MIDQALYQRLSELLQHNESAVDLNAALVETLHVWDDLIDMDKLVSDEDIHRAFRNALVVIPGNSFYREYFGHLYPLLDNLILNWMTANKMESLGEQLDIAWVIRSDYCNFLLKCLQIVGGFEYARSVWSEVRSFWHGEGYANYLISLEAEHNNKLELGVPLNVL